MNGPKPTLGFISIGAMGLPMAMNRYCFLTQTSGGVTTGYVYDNARRMTAATDRGDTVTYAYDSTNRLTTTNLPNGTTESKTYDVASGDLLAVVTNKGAATVSGFVYAYDGLGRKTTETLANGQVVSYAYDTAGQLTSEARSGANGYATAYTYDNAGNRLSKTLNGIAEAYTYDNANKLLTAGAKSYTYDAAGNTKTVTTGGAVTTLNWNAAGMLSGITYSGGNTNTFTYNGLKQRVGKTDSTGNFAYTLADDSIDATPLSDGVAVYRQAVGMIGEVRGGAKRYYNSDSLGSTRTIADATGTVSATKETDAFGNVWTPGTTGTQSPFWFAGQHGYQTDADSGLQKLGYRYYDASTGRFLSRDPIRDGYNWYIYCDNDPVNAVDPEGLEGLEITSPLFEPYRDPLERFLPKPKDDKPKSEKPIIPKVSFPIGETNPRAVIDIPVYPRPGGAPWDSPSFHPIDISGVGVEWKPNKNLKLKLSFDYQKDQLNFSIFGTP